MTNSEHTTLRYPVFFLFVFITFFPLFSCPGYDPIKDANYVASEVLFSESSLPAIRITLNPGDLEEILRPGNEQSDQYYPAILRFTNHLVDDDITSVGLRLRGNTSRYAEKISFKLSFNEYVPGRLFHGLKKFNLNGEHNDPCIIRCKICWNLFHSFGVPAPRANHVRLYINDEYRGLYINAEHIDGVFLQSRFGNDGGNLYKCLLQGAPADLAFHEHERYERVGNGETYTLHTNEADPDFSGLARFIDVLGNTPDEEFSGAIEDIFNVDGFLKWMAVSINCGSWDDYLWNANNYYLYHNLATGKFEFIPYDYDNTLGVSWGPHDWAKRDVYRFRNPDKPRPLAERILSNEFYVDRFSSLLDDFVQNHFSLELLEPEIDRLRSMIRGAAAQDLYRTCDYGWTIEDFDRSFNDPLGGHVHYGIKPFIKTRRQFTLAQIRPHPSPTPSPAPTETPAPTPTPDCLTTPTLVINEFCADNDGVIADSFGEFDDWIEIYNYGDESVWLGGLYLTDNAAQPTLFRLPDTIVLAPKSFLLFWADGQPDQGIDHLSFRLAKEGEAVGLYRRDECGNERIDLIQFGVQQTDVSYGREADAAPGWRFFNQPSPGASNN